MDISDCDACRVRYLNFCSTFRFNFDFKNVAFCVLMVMCQSFVTIAPPPQYGDGWGIMHQSFVTMASPPRWHSEANDISMSWFKTHPVREEGAVAQWKSRSERSRVRTPRPPCSVLEQDTLSSPKYW